jgi:hypothetical protein
MSEDGGFDYRTLSRAQIEYALNHIDGSKFPENLRNARVALDERISGVSPEPAPILDKATDAKYTFWMEKFLGLILTAYAAFGLAFNNLPVPVISGVSRQVRFVNLHGPAAWIGGLALLLAASIPFLGGLRNADPLAIRPRFRLLYVLAIILMFIALAVGKFGVSA